MSNPPNLSSPRSPPKVKPVTQIVTQPHLQPEMARVTRATDYELDELQDLNIGLENPDTSVSLAFPEGGREAWTSLLGSSLIMFPSFGFQVASKYLYQT